MKLPRPLRPSDAAIQSLQAKNQRLTDDLARAVGDRERWKQRAIDAEDTLAKADQPSIRLELANGESEDFGPGPGAQMAAVNQARKIGFAYGVEAG